LGPAGITSPKHVPVVCREAGMKIWVQICCGLAPSKFASSLYIGAISDNFRLRSQILYVERWQLFYNARACIRCRVDIVIITTLIIHHPIILPFQTQHFPSSQILPYIDIWHLFGLISRIPGLLYGFFSLIQFFF